MIGGLEILVRAKNEICTNAEKGVVSNSDTFIRNFYSVHLRRNVIALYFNLIQ